MKAGKSQQGVMEKTKESGGRGSLKDNCWRSKGTIKLFSVAVCCIISKSGETILYLNLSISTYVCEAGDRMIRRQILG